jgi:hypothetical protein
MKSIRRFNLIVTAVALLTAFDSQAFFDPHIGRWASRDPVGEKGGPNLHVFVRNVPISSVDSFGLQMVGVPGSGLPSWPTRAKPPPPDPVGFALCKRNVNPEGLGEWGLLIGFQILHPGTPTDHAYLHYKHCNKCEHIGWGIGGTKPGAPPIPEHKFNPSDCTSCRRTDSVLQYGAPGLKGTEATDSEILDCISSVPTSKPYKPTGSGQYNCLNWALEAASKCGLDCSGSKPK